MLSTNTPSRDEDEDDEASEGEECAREKGKSGNWENIHGESAVIGTWNICYVRTGY